MAGVGKAGKVLTRDRDGHRACEEFAALDTRIRKVEGRDERDCTQTARRLRYRKSTPHCHHDHRRMTLSVHTWCNTRGLPTEYIATSRIYVE